MKYYYKLLFVSLSLLVSTCDAAVDLADFFPFNETFGDTMLPKLDDASSEKITFKRGEVFPFVNRNETILWVNNNGDISFAQPLATYNVTCGPLSDKSRMIAVFWSDINVVNGGAVYYRTSQDKKLLEKASRDIEKRYPRMTGIALKWILIATWHNVAPHNKKVPSPPVNTFQLVLATDGTFGFAIMYFNKIEWTSGNKGHAKVGFDFGDRKNFVSVEGSCTSAVSEVINKSNVNEPGKFVFRVDTAEISTSNCEKDLYENHKEPVRISPCSVDTMGHVPVTFEGPCFPEDYTKITCTFEDATKGPINVAGVLVKKDKTPTVQCIAPYFYGLGRITVRITVETAAQSRTYFAHLSIVAKPIQLEVDLMQPKKISFKWNPALIDSSTVDFKMVWFNPKTAKFEDAGVVSRNVNNNGDAKFDFDAPFGFSSISKAELAHSFVSFAIASSELLQAARAKRQAPVGNNKQTQFFSDFFVPTIPGVQLKNLPHFEESKPPSNLVYCPCTETAASKDDSFFRKDNLTPSELAYFHAGAKSSYRGPTTSSGSGQHCVYDATGFLMVGAPSGSTADLVSPAVSKVGHYFHDVLPHILYCKTEQNNAASQACQRYFKLRPSNGCNAYRAPKGAQAYGDPHFTTFDGFEYTFNGAGEYLLIDGGEKSSYEVQVRMEEMPKAGATVLSAFALRQDSSKVQVQSSQSSRIDILIDGLPICLDGLLGDRLVLDGGNIAVSVLKPDVSEVGVTLSSGLSFKFSNKGAMEVQAFANSQVGSGTRGLLGNNDGLVDNDLQALEDYAKHANHKHGNLTIPADSDLVKIHHVFGQKWQISQKQSHFSYQVGKSYDSYSKPNYSPMFKLPISFSKEATELCKGSNQCLYDYVASGNNLDFAGKTLSARRAFQETMSTLSRLDLKCGDLGNKFENGSMTYSRGLVVGSVITFNCLSTHKLVGAAQIRCREETLTWDGPLPRCLVPGCRPLKSPDNGTVTVFSSKLVTFLPRSVAVVTCDKGYQIQGHWLMECTESEVVETEWNVEMPTCVPVKTLEEIEIERRAINAKLDKMAEPNKAAESNKMALKSSVSTLANANAILFLLPILISFF